MNIMHLKINVYDVFCNKTKPFSLHYGSGVGKHPREIENSKTSEIKFQHSPKDFKKVYQAIGEAYNSHYSPIFKIGLPEYTILADFGQSLLPQRVYTTPPDPPESPFSPCSPLCPGGPCFPGAPEGLVN